MPPQVGTEMGTPKPRKLRAASLMMTWATCVVPTTMMLDTALGSTCRNKIATSDAPMARAACTYSTSRSTSACARATRANTTHPVTPSTKMRLVRLGPTTAIMAMANSTAGNAIWMSAMRIKTLSTLPPAYPAHSPRGTPMPAETRTAVIPTASEIRAP